MIPIPKFNNIIFTVTRTYRDLVKVFTNSTLRNINKSESNNVEKVRLTLTPRELAILTAKPLENGEPDRGIAPKYVKIPHFVPRFEEV